MRYYSVNNNYNLVIISLLKVCVYSQMVVYAKNFDFFTINLNYLGFQKGFFCASAII